MAEQEAWVRIAEALWGPDFISSLSECFGIHRRTIERWRSGDQLVPPGVVADLVRLDQADRANRSYGAVLRRMARGETLEQIEASLLDDWASMRKLGKDVGQYPGIPALAGPPPAKP